MARLRDPGGQLIVLLQHHLIGRSRAMHTVVPSADVSAQHLAITWNGQDWSVRDLGSRNGTWLDGRRLTTGEEAPLKKGAVLTLGGPNAAFTLVDDGPPAPRAVSASHDVEGSAELLAIPSADEPLAIVHFDPEDGWVLSMDDQTAAVTDGQEVVVDGQTWRLSLPGGLDRTAEARLNRSIASALSLHFRVTADEEFVEVTVKVNGRPHKLPSKAHHYLLLTLARARLDDTDASPLDRGWVYSDDLMKGLRLSSNQLYVSLHRARKEVEALGVPDGGQLIERRTTTHQVRLGPRDVVVEVI